MKETRFQLADACFSTRELANRARVSLRQLQWWDERGLVSVRHERHRRIYTPDDAIQVIVISQLRQAGLSLQWIRRVLNKEARELMAGGYLVVARKRCMIAPNAEDAIRYAHTAGGSVVIVDLEGSRADLLELKRSPRKVPRARGQIGPDRWVPRAERSGV